MEHADVLMKMEPILIWIVMEHATLTLQMIWFLMTAVYAAEITHHAQTVMEF